jgi:hypothetical protein
MGARQVFIRMERSPFEQGDRNEACRHNPEPKKIVTFQAMT